VPHKTGVSRAADWRRLLEPGVSALGFELVDVELAGSGHHALLRVYIDRPEGVVLAGARPAAGDAGAFPAFHRRDRQAEAGAAARRAPEDHRPAAGGH